MEECGIVCSLKKFQKNENGEKILKTQTIKSDKIKVFLQKGKAQIDDKDIVDVAFVHYRDQKGRPVQLQLKENPEIVKVIRDKVFKEFGQIRIKAEGNLAAFTGQPCIEMVVTADAASYERGRFRYFNYSRCEPGLWKFDPHRPKRPKIRRLDPEELVVAQEVEQQLNKAFGTIGDICPELAKIKIDTEKIAKDVSSKQK